MVPIPARIAAGIDKIAGHRKRTAFVVEVLEREMRRREQLEALEQAAGAWADANHPELTNGADAWVREMRDASVQRLQEIERGGDAE
jgi:hypothetical protein